MSYKNDWKIRVNKLNFIKIAASPNEILWNQPQSYKKNIMYEIKDLINKISYNYICSLMKLTVVRYTS